MSDSDPPDNAPGPAPPGPEWGRPGTPPPGRPPYVPGLAPKHPSAQNALVLGLIGLAGAPACLGVTLLLSPFAWGVGRQALREIDEGQGAWRGRDEARIGYLTGIVGTALLALGLVAVIVVVLVLVAADA